jgi:DNA-binding NarL/FixJ family response regulator
MSLSLSVAGSAFPPQDFNHAAISDNSSAASKHSIQSPAKPAPAPAKPTEEQQLQKLVALGESNQQIATALGLTVTQVEQSLAGTSVAQNTASSLVALAGRLSIKA